LSQEKKKKKKKSERAERHMQWDKSSPFHEESTLASATHAKKQGRILSLFFVLLVTTPFASAQNQGAVSSESDIVQSFCGMTNLSFADMKKDMAFLKFLSPLCTNLTESTGCTSSPWYCESVLDGLAFLFLSGVLFFLLGKPKTEHNVDAVGLLRWYESPRGAWWFAVFIAACSIGVFVVKCVLCSGKGAYVLVVVTVFVTHCALFYLTYPRDVHRNELPISRPADLVGAQVASSSVSSSDESIGVFRDSQQMKKKE
jgi:hypothetical protein